MSQSALRDLAALGVAVNYDNIGRELITSGALARMIEEDGIAGETANPIIYQKAVAGSTAYDDDIVTAARRGLAPEDIVMELWAQDVELACDVFRPVYESTGHVDGFVSLELPPRLAHDAAGTVAAARQVWARVDRPNLAVKIPATPQAMPAIEECIAEGMNVNATVIFARDTYENVVQAYARGLERRRVRGLSLDVASFASVFMSRFDAPVDDMLIERIRESESEAETRTLRGLLGRVSIATAWSVYRRFREFFDGPDFSALRAAGARVQRPLWAGVVVRNSRYGDVSYMEALAIPGTALTAPDAPLNGFRQHGVPLPAEDDGTSDEVFATFAAAGIDVDDIAHAMEQSVVESFTDAFRELTAIVARKSEDVAVRV